MRAMHAEDLILLAADAARLVLESGGETYRAERVAMALAASQGGMEAECFATATVVILSFTGDDGRVRSVVRRIRRRSMNLEKVARIDRLVADLVADRITLEDAAGGLDAAERLPGRSAVAATVAAALGTAFFALLFGGGWREAVVAGTAGAAVALVSRALRERSLPDFMGGMAGGALAAALSLGALGFGLMSDLDTTVIAVIMLLVPGVAITNAIRDMMAGDLMSGLARGADAFLAAAAISAGTGAAFALMGLAGVALPSLPPATVEPARALAEPALAAAATAAFAYLFGLRRADIVLASLGGALAWAVSMAARGLGLPDSGALFAASCAIGLWGEVSGGIRRRPATVYTVAGLIPLVPGGGMYHTMLEAIAGNSLASMETGAATMTAAFSLAAGLAVADAASRLLAPARLPGPTR